MMLNRPATGMRLVRAMRYVDVNQLTESNASRSVAMEPWIVVRSEMLDVNTKIRAHIDRQMKALLVVVRTSCSFPEFRVRSLSSASVEDVEDSRGDLSDALSLAEAINGFALGRRIVIQ